MNTRMLVLGALLVAASTSKLANLTVCRLTPTDFPGIADRDTGDAAGDIFFTLYEAILPVYCPQNPGDSICTFTLFNNTNRNVYRQSVIEVDTNYGVYNGCNPQPNRTFICEAYLHHHNGNTKECWYNASVWDNKSFAKAFGEDSTMNVYIDINTMIFI